MNDGSSRAAAGAAAEQQAGFELLSEQRKFDFCLLCVALFLLLSLCTTVYASVFIYVCVCESSGVMRLKVLLRIAPLPSLAQPLPCSLSLPLCRRRCLCAFGLAMQFKLFDNSEKCIWLTKAPPPSLSFTLCLSVRVISGQRRDVGGRWS